MTEKRYDVIYEKEPRGQVVTDKGIPCTARTCCTRLNQLEEENKELQKENEQLKKEFFETSKELLWATSDEVDRALHYEDEVEELRKEIFE